MEGEKINFISIMYYEELADVTKHFRKLIVDLKHLNNKDFIRAIDFLAGLTNLNGRLKKFNKFTFEVEY